MNAQHFQCMHTFFSYEIEMKHVSVHVYECKKDCTVKWMGKHSLCGIIIILYQENWNQRKMSTLVWRMTRKKGYCKWSKIDEPLKATNTHKRDVLMIKCKLSDYLSNRSSASPSVASVICVNRWPSAARLSLAMNIRLWCCRSRGQSMYIYISLYRSK